jgi:hypothetical protein
MVRRIDIVFAISIILKIIIDQLGLMVILIIICIDSYFLYKYLVKLGITKEKYLIIDIITIR